MPTGTKDMWLKVLLTVLITLVLGSFTVGFAGRTGLDNKKVNKEYMNQHEKHQTEQFGYIKDSLDRIEGIKK
jgi:hypothetical protein